MIEFRVEWQDAPGVRDPVLARTWCRLTMDMDGQVVSRAIDYRSQSLRDGIYGSALPLCSWMVENWWCPPARSVSVSIRPWRSHDLVVNVDHRAWVQRHSLRAVGEGGILPDLMLFRDGDGVVVRWFADKADAAHPYLRFVGDGQASMPFEEVAQGLTDFVVRVLDRIEGMGAPEVEALRRDWAAITTAPPDERELCIWSARVGLGSLRPGRIDRPTRGSAESVGIVPGGQASGRPPRRGDGRCAPHGRALDRCCPRHCAGIRSFCSKRAGLGPRRAPLDRSRNRLRVRSNAPSASPGERRSCGRHARRHARSRLGAGAVADHGFEAGQSTRCDTGSQRKRRAGRRRVPGRRRRTGAVPAGQIALLAPLHRRARAPPHNGRPHLGPAAHRGPSPPSFSLLQAPWPSISGDPFRSATSTNWGTSTGSAPW